MDTPAISDFLLAGGRDRGGGAVVIPGVHGGAVDDLQVGREDRGQLPDEGAHMRSANLNPADPANADLDVRVSATHLFDPAASPTSGAMVLAASVTQPAVPGNRPPRPRNPSGASVIAYNLLATPRDRDRMLQLDVYAHPTSMVAMSAEGTGVVDSQGRVHGIDRLVVADASIMPLAPSAPPNVTTMMLADRVSRWLLGDTDTDTTGRVATPAGADRTITRNSRSGSPAPAIAYLRGRWRAAAAR